MIQDSQPAKFLPRGSGALRTGGFAYVKLWFYIATKNTKMHKNLDNNHDSDFLARAQS